MAPERKNIGITTKFMIALKLSMLSYSVAMIMPNDDMQKPRRKAIAMVKGIDIMPSLIPIKGKNRSIMAACMTDMIVPLKALPMTIENLDTGATRISFMRPNSLSQIMDIEENIELKRIVMPSMPGNMNCMYETPISGDTNLDIPPPTRKSQISGRASVEIRRLFSLTNFLKSLAINT